MADKQLTDRQLQRGRQNATPRSKTSGPGPAPRTFAGSMPDAQALRETEEQADKKPFDATSGGGGQGGGGA